MIKTKARQVLVNHSALVTLLVLIALASAIMGTTFFSAPNLMNILFNNAVIGIISLGMTFIIISGGIDLSVGSATAATGIFGLWVMNSLDNIVVGFLAAIALGVAIGALNGTLSTRFKIPAFIVTLGMMRVIRALSLHFMNGGGVILDRNISAFAFTGFSQRIGILPLTVVYWIVLAVAMALISNKTSFGRHIYAVGSNERASYLSAVNVKRVKTYVYMVSGALVAIAALAEGSRLGSMNSATSGNFYELEAIAAVIIGGTAMSGGRGRILGTVYGTLILGVINNLMNLMGLPSFLVGAIQGAIVILAVLLQRSVEQNERQF